MKQPQEKIRPTFGWGFTLGVTGAGVHAQPKVRQTPESGHLGFFQFFWYKPKGLSIAGNAAFLWHVRIRILTMVEIFAHSSAKRLLLLSLMPKQSTCAEIGAWKGHFSQAIVQFIAPKELHLIDPWLFQPDYPERLYGGKIAKSQEDMDEIYSNVSSSFAGDENVVIHRKKSQDCVEEFQDRFFDWIYIDGDHSYEGVRADLDLWYPKIKDYGFMTGDDFFWREPSDRETTKEAVMDFLDENRIERMDLIENQFIFQVRRS